MKGAGIMDEEKDEKEIVLNELKKLVDKYQDLLAAKKPVSPEPEKIRCNPGEVCHPGDVLEESQD